MKMIDKSEWGLGPWTNEPDEVKWVDQTGYDCLILRGPVGSLCGYVGVPKTHPWNGKQYRDVEEDIDVHGGLTYSDFKDGKWYFGFDCGHSGDYSPGLAALIGKVGIKWPTLHDTYKDVEYVKAEVVKLAAQLKKEEI